MNTGEGTPSPSRRRQVHAAWYADPAQTLKIINTTASQPSSFLLAGFLFFSFHEDAHAGIGPEALVVSASAFRLR